MKTISACFAVLRQHSSVHSLICSPVTGDVSRPDAAGLRKLNPRWHPTVPSQAASVGDELSCPASVRLVEVRPCRSTFRQLHWLMAAERIDFKLALLVYKCQHGAAPSYLADERRQPADCDARRRLPSASSPLLIVRRTRLSTIGDRAFPVAAAVFGTVCRTTSRRHHLWLSSAVASRRTSSGAAFHNPIPLLCLRSDTRHCRTH